MYSTNEPRGDHKTDLTSSYTFLLTKRNKNQHFLHLLVLVVEVVARGSQQRHHLVLRVLQRPVVLGHLQGLPLSLEGLLGVLKTKELIIPTFTF